MATWKKQIHLNLWRLQSRFQCCTLSDTTIWLQTSNKLLRKYHIYANGRIMFLHPPESCCLKMWCFKFAHEAPTWTVVSQTKAYTAKLSCTSCAEKEREKHAAVLLVLIRMYCESFITPLKYYARQNMAISMNCLLNANRQSYEGGSNINRPVYCD
jgi:hypothetical protein